MLDDRELIKEVIIPNLPMSAKYQLKMQGGSMLSWNRLKELLINLFALTNWEQNKPKGNRNNNRRRGNNGNNGGRGNFRNGNNGYNNSNNNNNNRNENNTREETYQQKNTQNRPTREKYTESYYSDDKDREENNMMTARMKYRKTTKENNLKKTTPKSCVIVVNVHTAYGRKNCLALANTESSATLANEAIVSKCSKEKEKKEVK